MIQKIFRVALVLFVIAATTPWTFAQQGPLVDARATQVQQSAGNLDVSTFYQSLDASAVATNTLTITPNGPTGYVVIDEIDISNCAGASAVSAATTTVMTTTGFSGSPTFVFGSGVTAGQCAQSQAIVFPHGLRSATAGTPVTFVLPVAKLNQGIHLNVAGKMP